jgi:hypothetical protein
LPAWKGSTVAMTSAEVVLRALDLVVLALASGSEDAAIEVVRADLEVLDRDSLVRVATALAVETPLRWVAPAYRVALMQRLQRERLELIWAGS